MILQFNTVSDATKFGVAKIFRHHLRVGQHCSTVIPKWNFRSKMRNKQRASRHAFSTFAACESAQHVSCEMHKWSQQAYLGQNASEHIRGQDSCAVLDQLADSGKALLLTSEPCSTIQLTISNASCCSFNPNSTYSFLTALHQS